MRSACSLAPQPLPGINLSLRTIWDVDADSTYDVAYSWPHDSRRVVACTRGGAGRLYFDSSNALDVAPGTLLFFELRHVRRYHTVGARWQFWWFEFTSAGALPMPVERALGVRFSPDDRRDFRVLFAALRRETPAQRRLASALFAMMLQRWLASAPPDRPSPPHAATLEKVIARMHASLFEGWTVHAMATEAHMSERRFRQVFADFTGHTPKSFYDGLRLAMAQEILRQGRENISQVADRLRYSSPFHFSKAFRARFGFPPSRIQRPIPTT